MHPTFVDIYKFKTWKQCGTPILVCSCKKPPEVFFQSHQVTCVSAVVQTYSGAPEHPSFSPFFLGDEECQNGSVGATNCRWRKIFLDFFSKAAVVSKTARFGVGLESLLLKVTQWAASQPDHFVVWMWGDLTDLWLWSLMWLSACSLLWSICSCMH